MDAERFITLAIHTFEKARPIKAILEREGIEVELHNVNLASPEVFPGVRIRIRETDLPLALRIVENLDVFHPFGDDSTIEALGAMPYLTSGKSAKKAPVMVPTDFSDHSLQAAELAVELASRLKTSVVVFNSFLTPQSEGTLQLSSVYNYASADSSAAEKARAQAEEQIAALACKLRQKMKNGELPPVKIETAVAEGLPEEAILEYARGVNRPLLIVMGTRGKERKDAELIGSVSAEVLDSCRLPALTIPEGTSGQLLSDKNPCVAFFCSLDQEDMVALDTLGRMFPDLGAEVILIHIPERHYRKTTAQKAGENLLTYCREHFPAYTFDLQRVELTSVINDIQAIRSKHPFTLVCVPNRRRNVFARVFNPSMAHRILFMADIPMLAVPV